MSIIMQGALEWYIEQARIDLVESLEKDGVEVPDFLKESTLGPAVDNLEPQ